MPEKRKSKKFVAISSQFSEGTSTTILDLEPSSTLHIHVSVSDSVELYILHANNILLDGFTPADIKMLVNLQSREHVKRLIEFPLVVVINPGVKNDLDSLKNPKAPSKKGQQKSKKRTKGPVKLDQLRKVFQKTPDTYKACCIDFLPLMMGENELRIRCVCQSILPNSNIDKQSPDIEVQVVISWQGTDSAAYAATALEEVSLITLTVERACGLPGQRYSVDMVMPGDEGDSGKKITFSSCRPAKHGEETQARWRSAEEFGCAARSDYRLDDEKHNIYYSEDGLDLSLLFDEESALSNLLWTSCHRGVLWPAALENLRHLSTFHWTFYVNDLATRKQFIAIANFEVLLEPGETSVRVATPLLCSDAVSAMGGGEGAHTALLLVKMELSKPLVKAYTNEQIFNRIDRHIPEAPKKPPKSMFKLQEETFMNVVRQVETSIQDQYLNFYQTQPSQYLSAETWAESYVTSWTTELNDVITSQLAVAVKEFIGEDGNKDMDEIDRDEAVSWWYATAVSAMHLGLNQEPPPVTVAPDPGEIAEASAMGDCAAYRKMLLQTLSASPENIDVWIALASLELCDGDDEGARTALHRALQIDQRHPLALLCYGSLLLSSEPKEAEWFVRGVLLENPNWLECWAAARALFCHQGRSAAAHVAKLHIDRTILRPDPEIMKIEPHAPYWIYTKLPRDSTLLASEMLARCGAFQWAELCINISDKADQYEKTRSMAKLKLLSGKAEESTGLASLATKLSRICPESRWLEAECLWAAGSSELATKMWLTSGSPPPAAARARIGLQLLQTKDVKNALRHYGVACRDAPSSYAWTGLGLAHWELGSKDLSERCLAQATRLGGKDAWLHLYWLNRCRGKYERAERCLTRANMMGVSVSDIALELQRCWAREECPAREFCATK